MMLTTDGMAVLACCGFKNSGKTTLIEGVIPLLRARGLSVAVVKHDAHGVQFDRPGKDSDRFFRAGADVVVRGSNESAARWHPSNGAGSGSDSGPAGCESRSRAGGGPQADLIAEAVAPGRGRDRASRERHRDPTGPAQGRRPGCRSRLRRSPELLDETWRSRTVLAGVLVGGSRAEWDRRNNSSITRGRTLIHRVIDGLGRMATDPVLLGSGRVPDDLAGTRRLPDVPGIAGPLAGWWRPCGGLRTRPGSWSRATSR